MAAAAENLTPVIAECGGKDALIVDADADLSAAADAAAWGALSNAGQTCVGIERVYVADPVYETFLAKLADRVSRLRPGSDDGADYGPGWQRGLRRRAREFARAKAITSQWMKPPANLTSFGRTDADLKRTLGLISLLHGRRPAGPERAASAAWVGAGPGLARGLGWGRGRGGGSRPAAADRERSPGSPMSPRDSSGPRMAAGSSSPICDPSQPTKGHDRKSPPVAAVFIDVITNPL